MWLKAAIVLSQLSLLAFGKPQVPVFHPFSYAVNPYLQPQYNLQARPQQIQGRQNSNKVGQLLNGINQINQLGQLFGNQIIDGLNYMIDVGPRLMEV